MKENLNEVCEEINKVLHCVENDIVVKGVDDLRVGIQIEYNDLIGFDLNESIPYLKNLLDRINDCIETLKNLPQKIDNYSGSENKFEKSDEVIKSTHPFLKKLVDEYWTDISLDYYCNELTNELSKVREEIENVLIGLEKLSKQPLSYKKISTTLTVDEIAYLFRAFEDRGLIKVPNGKKMELLRAISSCFSPKSKDQLSEKTLKKYYYSPTENAAEYWQEKFRHLVQYADEQSYLK